MAEESSASTPPNGGNSTKKSSGSGLTKKVGPLPLWGWGAAAFVIVIAYSLLKKKNGPSTTGSSAGKASASPAYSQMPIDTGSYYYDGTYPVAGVNGTSAASSTTKHPYGLVSTVADLEQALNAGIPQDWLAYTGTDPEQARASQDPTAAPPTGLPLFSSLPQGSQVAWLGASEKIAPDNAVKVYGQTRKGTLSAAQQWYNAFQQYGQNVGFYVPQ